MERQPKICLIVTIPVHHRLPAHVAAITGQYSQHFCGLEHWIKLDALMTFSEFNFKLFNMQLYCSDVRRDSDIYTPPYTIPIAISPSLSDALPDVYTPVRRHVVVWLTVASVLRSISVKIVA